MNNEIETQVERYIQVVLSNPDAEDDAIIDALVKSGIAKRRAHELVLWVPMAFGRCILSGSELEVPQYYRVVGNDNSVTLRRKLSDEVVFVAATHLPDQLRRNGFQKDQILVIASRSAEFKAVNKALHAGAKLANLRMSEPVVYLPDGDSTEHSAVNARPWWKIW